MNALEVLKVPAGNILKD